MSRGLKDETEPATGRSGEKHVRLSKSKCKGFDSWRAFLGALGLLVLEGGSLFPNPSGWW